MSLTSEQLTNATCKGHVHAGNLSSILKHETGERLPVKLGKEGAFYADSYHHGLAVETDRRWDETEIVRTSMHATTIFHRKHQEGVLRDWDVAVLHEYRKDRKRDLYFRLRKTFLVNKHSGDGADEETADAFYVGFGFPTVSSLAAREALQRRIRRLNDMDIPLCSVRKQLQRRRIRKQLQYRKSKPTIEGNLAHHYLYDTYVEPLLFSISLGEYDES